MGYNRFLFAEKKLLWSGDIAPIISTDYHPSHIVSRVRNIWTDYYYRSKYGNNSGWGYWDITSSNQKIYFIDTGLTARTANVVVDEYDADSLATAIKTAMEAVTSDTFTISYSDNSNKFTIQNTTGTFTLTCTHTTGALWDDIGYDTSADKTGAATYQADYVRIHMNAAVVFETVDSSAVTVDCCALFGLNLTSSYQVLKIQRWTGSAWEDKGDFDYDVTLGQAIVFTSSSSSSAKWRVLIRDWTNSDGYAQVGFVFPGRYKELSRGYEYGSSWDIEDTSSHLYSKKGYLNVKVGFQKTLHSVEYEVMSADEVKLKDLYEDVGKVHPFVFVRNSDDAINTMEYGIFRAKFGRREESDFFKIITLAWESVK